MANLIPFTSHPALYDVKLTEQELNVIIIVMQNAIATGAVPKAWVAKVVHIQELALEVLDEEFEGEDNND